MSVRTVHKRKRRKIAIGDFRTQVTALSSSTAPTIEGGIEKTLTPVFTTRMKEETLAFGRHGFKGVNINEAATHIFTARYRDDLTAELVLERRGTRFEILEDENLEGRDEYLKLQCRELGSSDREATKS